MDSRTGRSKGVLVILLALGCSPALVAPFVTQPGNLAATRTSASTAAKRGHQCPPHGRAAMKRQRPGLAAAAAGGGGAVIEAAEEVAPAVGV